MPQLHFEADYVENVKGLIPELPQQKRQRFASEYGLDENIIEIFVRNKDLSEYYEKVVSEFDEWISAENIQSDKKMHKLVANYLITDVQGLLAGKTFDEKDFKTKLKELIEKGVVEVLAILPDVDKEYWLDKKKFILKTWKNCWIENDKPIIQNYLKTLPTFYVLDEEKYVFLSPNATDLINWIKEKHSENNNN